MSGAWDEIRSAIADKLDASTGCTAAGLRRATTKTDDPLTMLPEVRVLQPGYTLQWQTGVTEAFTLDVPFELVVSRPAGLKRSNPIAAAIARAIQVEFQSGYRLSGLSLGLVNLTDCRLVSMTPGLVDYADLTDPAGNPLDLDGYRGVVSVEVQESVTRSV